MATHTSMAQGSNATMRNSLEQRLGIIHYVSTREHGWSGQTRTRYTDFQVREITKDGEVVHLKDFYNNAREMARATSQNSNTPSGTKAPSQPVNPHGQVVGSESVSASREPATSATRTEGNGSPTDGISEADRAALVQLVGQTAADDLIAFYEKIQQDSKTRSRTLGDVKIPAIGDKARRSQVHGEIRRIFNGKIETTTDSSDDSIKATAARVGGRQRGDRNPNNGGRNGRQNAAAGSNGPYLHFSLYKENKDTMDALNHMAKTLRIHPKSFGAAGTKDRRAVTVQRVSVKGRSPSALISVNERISNIKIGDFVYAQDPIKLNDHDGNEFAIVLKNCVFSGTENLNFEETLGVAKSTVESALAQVTQHGFINYYGTQRFGTHQIGTQEIGMKILKGDFAGAANALLAYSPDLLQNASENQGQQTRGVHRDDISRARACSAFLDNNDAKAALELLPPRCHVERTMIQHLSRSPADYLGALMSINRSMRTMYGHAYQSLVWNFVASKRWERFGSKVINGDLVLVKSQSAPARGTDDTDMDLVWEDEIPGAHNSGLVAHAVTEDDLQDGKYSIYDVVLPTPGWDVTYPPNEIGEFYVEFMGRPENGGLNPYDMRRRQRDFSFPGSYRKLMGKLKRVPTASVQAYSNDLEQLVPTDLDIIQSRRAVKTAKRDTPHDDTAMKWQNFAKNVKRDELEEAKARARQLESQTPASPVRISDTWIQTSVDGSNKRVKVEKHADDTTNDVSSDAMRVDSKTESGSTVVGDEDTAKPGPVETTTATQGEQNADTAPGWSIVTAIKEQPASDDAQSKAHEAPPPPPHGSDSGSVVAAVESNASIPRKHADNVETATTEVAVSPSNANELGTSEAVADLSSEAVGKVEPAPAVPVEPTDAKKIAVILRFALDTSQYATMVIRELQGTPSANEST
ncbi:pseudouridine synthase [Poronia punctata]|nr:pseudouridine synthase [Poronia punctata]